MSKKKNNNNVNNEAQRKKKNESGEDGGGGGGGAGKKVDNNAGNAVVLKIDLHCEGCSSKIVKYVRGFPGVETVKVDGGTGKITVTGKVDAVKLREKLEEKMHKKVELISPAAKKEKGKNDDAADGKDEKKKDSKENKPTDKNYNNKSSNKNQKDSKEPQVTTAVLKVALHCEGCIRKIHKIVTKTKGFEEMKVDKQKDLVTVKGAMDMKVLVESLKKHLKRDVEIIPPKKDEKKEKGSGGGREGKAAAAGAGAGAGGGRGGEGGGEKMEGSKMQQQVPPPQPPPAFGPFGYGYPNPPSPFVYGGPGPAYFGDPYQVHYHIHAPQLFSDENPNACSIM